MKKPDFCMSGNKDFKVTAQISLVRDNRAADHRLCFRYIYSTISLLAKSEISNLYPSKVVVQPGL